MKNNFKNLMKGLKKQKESVALREFLSSSLAEVLIAATCA
jgi:hypothetical protein